MSSYQGRYAADTDTSYKTDSVEESEYFYRAKHDAGSLRPAVEIRPEMDDDEDGSDTASEIIERSLKRADEKVRAERNARETEPGPDYKALKCQLSFECLAKQANKGLLLVQGCRSIQLKTFLLKH